MTSPVTVKCSHGIVCLTGGQGNWLLHPMDMSRCSDSAVNANDIAAVLPPETIRGHGADTIVSAHRVVRDGSVWLCLGCRATRPFGRGAAEFAGECVPVRWGDRPVTTGDEAPGVTS